MRLLGLYLALTAIVAGQIPVEGDSRLRVELRPEVRPYYVGELISVPVVIQIEETFARDALLQFSRQKLDVPVVISAPWLLQSEAAEVEPAPDASNRARRVSMAFEGGITSAEARPTEVREGKTYRVFVSEYALTPTIDGDLVLRGTKLRCAYATRFEQDLITGKKALDRQELIVSAPELRLQILPLPELGRPLSFGGAIGTFTMETSVVPTKVALGQSSKLVVTIRGTGNLQKFVPPTFDFGRSFHNYGMLDDRGLDGRVLTFDLAPTRGGPVQVPELRFSYFDPTPPGRYVEIRSAATSIQVLQPVGGTDAKVTASASDHLRAGVDDIYGLWSGSEFEQNSALPKWLLRFSFLAPWPILACCIVARHLKRRDPLALRRARAYRRFQRRPRTTAKQRLHALMAYVADQMGTAPAAAIDQRLAERLEHLGFDGQASRALAHHLERLVAETYGARVDASTTDDFERDVLVFERAALAHKETQ